MCNYEIGIVFFGLVSKGITHQAWLWTANQKLVGFLTSYSLSDPILAYCFFLFSVTKTSCLPSKLGKPLRSTNFCMYIPTFCLNSIKCWFCSLGPIVKVAHCKHYKCERSCVEFYYRHLIGKMNILQIWERELVYRYRHSDPKRFAMFG